MAKPTVFWLDDEPRAIARWVKGLRKGGFHVEVFERPSDVTDRLKAEAPSAFLVDLLFDNGGDGENGVGIALTAKGLQPFVPIVAVTEHLDAYRDPIIEALKEGRQPFSELWEKDSFKSPSELMERLSRLLGSWGADYQGGIVLRMDEDYSDVRLQPLQGDVYERSFETAFLRGCGVTDVGDKLDVIFRTLTHDGKWGEVRMGIRCRLDEGEDAEAEVNEIMREIDMDRIRDVLGPKEPADGAGER